MDPHDIAATLQMLNLLKSKDGNVVILRHKPTLDAHMEKVNTATINNKLLLIVTVTINNNCYY